MKQWTKKIEINAPIEQVWKFFDGNLEDMQKIMPQVVEYTPIKITKERVGSVYRQKYKEGKRFEEYDVKILDYLNTMENKKLKVGFTLANMFDITAAYKLTKLNDDKTLLTYTATNRSLKWYAKLMLMFATEKVVVNFLNHVKHTTESEKRD